MCDLFRREKDGWTYDQVEVQNITRSCHFQVISLLLVSNDYSTPKDSQLCAITFTINHRIPGALLKLHWYDSRIVMQNGKCYFAKDSFGVAAILTYRQENKFRIHVWRRDRQIFSIKKKINGLFMNLFP